MQRRRLFFQLGFFALFLLAPALDLLRFDLNEAQLWFLGQRWSLGIDAFRAGEITAQQAAIQIMLRAFLPGIALVVGVSGRGLSLRPPVLRLVVSAFHPG